MDEASGIAGVERGIGRVQTPPGTPAGEHWRYGTGFFFQVSSDQAALAVGIHRVSAHSWDYEMGTDLILFDDPRALIAEGAIAVSRNHREQHPRLGTPVTMVKYPLHPGFIPIGARQADGAPHPHAGTGFGLCQAMANDVEEAAARGERRHTYDLKGDNLHAYFELAQFQHDGRSVVAAPPERLAFDALLPGVRLTGTGLSCPIADGEDLLLPMVSGRAAGVARWRRGARGWRPVEFSPVNGEELSFSEPSLVRDADGALLFTGRPGGAHIDDVLIWRSGDGGATWARIIQAPHIRQASPVALHQAADGTPYVACNQSLRNFINCGGALSEGQFREILCLWPLKDDRAGLGNPFFVCVPRYDYGPPRHGYEWYVDHPLGATLRLAGRWRHLLGYRIMAIAEGLGQGFPPTPHSGLHVSEVLSAGPARAPWLFLSSQVKRR